MLRNILLLLCLCSLAYGQTSGCSANINLVERPGAWMEMGVEKRIFDLHIINTGSCSFSGAITTTVTVPAGTFIGYSWGFNAVTNTITVPNIDAGQTYAGVGFILSGEGTPSFTVQSIGTCGCASTGSSTTGHDSQAPVDDVSGGDGLGPDAGGPGATSGIPSTTGSPYLDNSEDNDPNGSAYDLHLDVLVLSCLGNESTLGVAALILDGVGAAYDIFSAVEYGSTALQLTNADGSGKYYAIVAASDLSCWGQDQQSIIAQYEIAFHVKVVVLYTYPYAANGVSPSSTLAGGALLGNLTYAPAMTSFATSLRTDAVVSIHDVWVYPTTISDSSKAEAAYYIKFDGDDTQYVAAAFVTPGDGRRHMEFYFDQGTWALFACIVGPGWFNWVTNGLFAGARRIEFNVHTDDVFMATGMYDDTIHEEGETTYRITPADLDQMVTWQNEMVARMPAGSSFVTTFPFNGETIQEHGGYTEDKLYLHAKVVRDNFFWESHTWDHPYLDNLTYDEVYSEFNLNLDTANELFDNDLTNPVYNPTAVITPSITGLFNGDALKAMWDLGIRAIVGDNSHPEQLPAFPWHGWYTNVTSNGFDGMYIVPRHATNIYYDASEPEHIYPQYNYMYNTDYDFDDIIALEVVTNTRNLLQLRHDPFMFHQANMRTITYNGKTTSLLAYWCDAIVDSVLSYVTLPMTSHRHEDLVTMLHAREARDACGFRGRLHVDSSRTTITGIYAQSTGSCVFPISGATATPDGSRITYETSGDEKTIWVSMDASSPIEIDFTTPISIA